MPSSIGLADDPKTCAFCGKPVAAHTGTMAYACRAGLNNREKAAEQAVKQEAAEQAVKKSKEEILDDLDEQISALEDKRKELKLEIEKEEILEKVLSGKIDLTAEQEKSLHTDCHTHEEVEEARDEGFQGYEEAWGYIHEFGSHTATCLSGALVGEKRPHPLCTCGWNHVATEAER